MTKDNERNIKIKIGKNIRSARKKRKMTQSDLAKCLNRGQVCISGWELGKAIPSVLDIIEMKKIINLKIKL